MADHLSLRVAAMPATEYSPAFLQGMLDRMAFGYASYGPLHDAYPHKVDAVRSLRKRLELYLETGNTEWLMDVANFAMIEFLCPSHTSAHYSPTGSDASPGRAWSGGHEHRRNDGTRDRV